MEKKEKGNEIGYEAESSPSQRQTQLLNLIWDQFTAGLLMPTAASGSITTTRANMTWGCALELED